MPSGLTKVDSAGTPYVSILVAAVVGIACFGPFPMGASSSASSRVRQRSSMGSRPWRWAHCTRSMRDRPRNYKAPAPSIILPLSFVSANLILYWGRFEYTWKILVPCCSVC